MILTEDEWVDLPTEDPELEKASAFDLAQSARAELEQINQRMIVLAVRKAELEEVVQAIETIERFATLSREGTEE